MRGDVRGHRVVVPVYLLNSFVNTLAWGMLKMAWKTDFVLFIGSA